MTTDEALAHLKGALQRGDWTPRTNDEAFDAIESRLVALQRVAEAAKKAKASRFGDLADLLDALRALEE